MGAWLTSLHAWSKRLVPFSGGILIGVAIFWVLPEMAEALTWMNAFVWIEARGRAPMLDLSIFRN